MIVRQPLFEESTMPDFTDWMDFDADKFIVLSDVESPNFDARILDMVGWAGQELDIDTLIYGGDLFENIRWSKWRRMYHEGISFREEVERAIKIINIHGKIFSRQKLIKGNHERRFDYHCDGEYSLKDIVEKETNVEFSDYAHCYVQSGGRKIMVVHQDNYSKVALSVPSEIASIHLCDTACTHTHRLALGWDKSSQFQIAECGHGRALTKTPYVMMRKNRMPIWNSGFLLVMDGVFQTVHPDNFDQIMRQGISLRIAEIEEKLAQMKEGAS